MKQSINLRQMGCLAGVMIFANKILVLPSLFFDKLGADGLFILIGYFLVDLLLLAVFFSIKLIYQKETFFDVLSTFLTKYGAIIVYFLILRIKIRAYGTSTIPFFTIYKSPSTAPLF